MKRDNGNVNKGMSEQAGQVVAEYFVLFAAIALLTIVGVAKAVEFLGTGADASGIRGTLGGFFQGAVAKITTPDTGAPAGNPGGPGPDGGNPDCSDGNRNCQN